MHSAAMQDYHIAHGAGKKGRTRGLLLIICRQCTTNYDWSAAGVSHFPMTTSEAMQHHGQACKHSDAKEEDGRPDKDDVSTLD